MVMKCRCILCKMWYNTPVEMLKSAAFAAEKIGEIHIENENMNSSRSSEQRFRELNKSFDAFMEEDTPQKPVNTDMTQRIQLERNSTPKRPANGSANPQRRSSSTAARQDRPTPKKRKSRMSKKEQITIAILCGVAAVLLIAAAVALTMMLSGHSDDGLIMNNVYVAGVNLGGMSQEQAKTMVGIAAKDFEEKDMTVTVLDTTILLKPSETGAKLDVDAAVKAAYEYGRNGEKVNNQSTHTISILPYLNLDLDYIRQQVDALGAKYSTLRADASVRVEGTAPPSVMEEYDTGVIYQTMYIFTGTAEYDLSTDKLYQQILSAYDSKVFEVTGQCNVLTPNISAVEALEQAYAKYCANPVDASIDENFNVTKEIYGYGFDLETVKAQLSAAEYGETIPVPMHFVRPDITAEDLAGNLFKDILGSCNMPVENNTNLIANLNQVIKSLNGMILKSGEEFSFNDLTGEPTRQRGYKPYSQYVGKVFTENVYGGGLSQLASALYYCALQADLDILERHSHAYAPSFITLGLDADVKYGSMDLKLRNSTSNPIRILAEVKNGALHIQLLGTDTKDYTIEIRVDTDKVYDPVVLFQTMNQNNAGGYKDGQILQTPITGYDVSVYKVCTYKPVLDENGDEMIPPEDEVLDDEMPVEPEPPFEIPVGQSHYDKRNTIQVNIYTPPAEPTVPSEPSEPNIPGESTSVPTETVTPSETTQIPA